MVQMLPGPAAATLQGESSEDLVALSPTAQVCLYNAVSCHRAKMSEPINFIMPSDSRSDATFDPLSQPLRRRPRWLCIVMPQKWSRPLQGRGWKLHKIHSRKNYTWRWDSNSASTLDENSLLVIVVNLHLALVILFKWPARRNRVQFEFLLCKAILEVCPDMTALENNAYPKPLSIIR